LVPFLFISWNQSESSCRSGPGQRAMSRDAVRDLSPRAVQLYRGFALSSAPQPAPSPKPAARKPPVRRAAANFAPYSSCTAPRCAAAIIQSYLFRRSRASSAWVWTCPRP